MTYEYSKGFPPFSAEASLDVIMYEDGMARYGYTLYLVPDIR